VPHWDNYGWPSTYPRTLALIRSLEGTVLSWELCPEPEYWHWRILQPGEVPEALREHVVGEEIRW
jgi:hypothetical protein